MTEDEYQKQIVQLQAVLAVMTEERDHLKEDVAARVSIMFQAIFESHDQVQRQLRLTRAENSNLVAQLNDLRQENTRLTAQLKHQTDNVSHIETKRGNKS